MAKNRKKGKKKPQSYEIGYCKPPEEYKWKKGCPSPNPKGRPKKIRTLKEALQLSFNKEVNGRDENGEVKKITCLEALATKTIADAIAKDGPTRRMLYRQDLLNLISKEPELEVTEDELRLVEIEKDYGELLRKWAETPEKVREAMTNLMREQLQEITNEKLRKENQNER
jgi:hypothetical protein